MVPWWRAGLRGFVWGVLTRACSALGGAQATLSTILDKKTYASKAKRAAGRAKPAAAAAASKSS